MPTQPSVEVIGAGPWTGAYLLRLALSAACTVRFGRYARGEPILLESGDYVYIGSAQGQARHRPLIRRVNRHLLRTALRPAQPLYPVWQTFLDRWNLHPPAPVAKRLHWHIDYLLDEPACDVVQVILIPSSCSVEQRLTEVLEALPAVRPVAPGLGASDHPGHTHLLHWQGTQAAWSGLLAELPSLASIEEAS